MQKSEVTISKSIKGSAGASAGIPHSGELKATIEGELHKQHVESEEDARSFEEEIEVTVPAKSTVAVLLHWKIMWDNSTVVVKFSDGTTVEVPVRESAGVTFDQENQDL